MIVIFLADEREHPFLGILLFLSILLFVDIAYELIRENRIKDKGFSINISSSEVILFSPVFAGPPSVTNLSTE
ncbi:hypothetical protein C5167_048441 [Papaver somniferum]|uniref:Uncharacterized protein n=1 Tax=Papaver somniferum TaxID=3469 RepID=A0A4Y7KKS0_PAPSO|nr:hypothetical protein C5167_048441 [Papaver somniferum]